MIELVLAHADLARVRFAHSPIHELAASLLVLQDPSRRPMYGDWLSSVRPRLDGHRLELLTALVPPSRYLPAFPFPAPAVPRPALADQLEAVVASPPAVVRTELDKVGDGRPLPAVLRGLMRTRPGTCPPSPRRSSATGRLPSCRCGRGCRRSAPWT
jgi:hypothetical protein